MAKRLTDKTVAHPALRATFSREGRRKRGLPEVSCRPKGVAWFTRSGGPLAHRPSQVGWRFSMKAEMPSSASRASMFSTMTRAVSA